MSRTDCVAAGIAALVLAFATTVHGQGMPTSGRIRQLVCRGGPGTHLAVRAEPSPRGTRQVEVTLPVRASAQPPGPDYRQLEIGTCTWNPTQSTEIPHEPAEVHFDLDLVGSEQTPDRRGLEVWLNDPAHFWVFYVDDVTRLSVSHGSYVQPYVGAKEPRESPENSNAGLAQRVELRCRGGSGLAFARGPRAGTNLVGMTLSYRASGRAAGAMGTGLWPGTCAWARRKDVEAEPGRVAFITAGNAQLKQIQSGSAVDRSPTAAERWPDVHTIPVYLQDPRHYWTFTIQMSNSDSALQHSVWKPSIEKVAITPPPTPDTVPTTPIQMPATAPTPSGGTPAPMPTGGAASAPAPMPTGGAGSESAPMPTGGAGGSYTPGTGTSASLPGGSSAGEPYSAGTSNSFIDPRIAFDIHDVQATPGLEGVVIRFEAGPEIAPSVLVSTAAPVGASGGQRFDGQTLRLTVQGTPATGGRWRYVAASGTPLARGTQYWFLADAPEGRMSRQNQVSGQFRTLAQHVTIGFTEIYVISDGDSDSNGELHFELRGCPLLFDRTIAGTLATPLDWSEGRHRIAVENARTDTSVPDRFRILIGGVEDDETGTESGSTSFPLSFFNCEVANPDVSPGKNSRVEWNTILMDFDLTTMPGPQATQTFQRRSKPLANGSTLMFEVTGWIRVNRE